MNNKKILITGVAGFLGSHLADKLHEMGYTIVGIDNMLCGYEDNIPKNIEFHKIDCCDLEKVQKVIRVLVLFIIVRQQPMKDCQFFLL